MPNYLSFYYIKLVNITSLALFTNYFKYIYKILQKFYTNLE